MKELILTSRFSIKNVLIPAYCDERRAGEP
jgi:hypothetical protein